MNSPQFNSPQMEFGFVQAVTCRRRRRGNARKSAAQLRAEKVAVTTGVAGEGTLKSPLTAPLGTPDKHATRIDLTDPPGVLSGDWIRDVCGNIESARDLREAVTLFACYLTELIDCEIAVRGHNEAWKQEYEAYCWTQYFNLTVEEETELEELRALWWGAAIVLNADNGTNDRSDWELFEDLCVFEADFGDLDGNRAEAAYIEFLSLILSKLHGHLFRVGGRAFTALNQHSHS
jgi:hypothetical protein